MRRFCGALLSLALLVVALMGNGMTVSAKTVTYYPTEISDVLINPYMGWVPDAGKTNYSQPHTMVYAAILWSELEPDRKEDYNWEEIEKKYNFDYWKSKGVRINIRFYMDLPGSSEHMDIPQWLYNSMGSNKGTKYNCSIGKGFSPNYEDSVLIKEHERVIKAMGERYNNDPYIAFIQLGSIGHWGEWHVWPTAETLNDSFSGYFPSESTCNKYISHYLNAFSSDKLCMRRGTTLAKNNQMGLFNDMMGTKSETDSWLKKNANGYTDSYNNSQQPAMGDFWKYGPSGGEFSYGNAAQHLEDSVFSETLRQVKECHTSWLGPCSPAVLELNGKYQKNIDTLMKTMGYRYVLKSISHADTATANSKVAVTMNWENKGVAPFYFNWSVRIGLANKNGVVTYSKVVTDIREWLPGSKTVNAELTIPSTVKDGEYTVVVAIIDPATDKPGVNLAINGKRSDGWYALDTIKVSGSGSGSSGGSGTGVSADGKVDWSSLTPVTKSTGQSAASVKVTNDANYLYMRIDGTGLGSRSQIFLDSDNKKTTGYIDSGWKSAGMDYMIENGKLYYHSANDSSWNWTKVADANITVTYTSSYIEMKLSRSYLAGKIAFTFKDVDNNWAVVSTLPWKENYAYYAMK